MNTLLSEPSFQSLMKVTQRPDAVMARGAGSWLWDEAGNAYLDFLQGWAVNALGHCAPEVTAALTQQAQILVTPSPALHNRPQLNLAQTLTTATDMQTVHFSNSGAEANEVALKLARKWGQLHRDGAYQVLTTNNAFHGRTLATMAASGKPGWELLFPPYPDGFCQVPYGDLDAMAAAINGQTVAIMVEPVQGEAGVVVPPTDYLPGLRQLADQHNLLLIFDEIQTGIGRLGRFVAAQLFDVTPDVMTLGKGIGNGLPLSATLANDRAACFDYGDQGGTYNGNPLMTAVAQAVVDVVSNQAFLDHVEHMGCLLRRGLTERKHQYGVVEVRGYGLLNAIKLDREDAPAVVHAAFNEGLLINAARPDTLRFMPSLRLTEAELADFFARLDAAFDHCAVG